MSRSYNDISHFRAPYKNSMMSGYGCAGGGCAGYGAADAPKPFYITKDGNNVLNPHWKDSLRAALGNYVAHTQQTIAGPGMSVILQPFTKDQMDKRAVDPQFAATLWATSADRWVLANSKDHSIFLSPQAIEALLKGEGIPAGHNKIVAYPPGSEGAKAGLKGSVLIGGSAVSGASFLGIPLKTLLIVGGVAVVGTVVYKSMKKGGGRSSSMSMPASL